MTTGVELILDDPLGDDRARGDLALGDPNDTPVIRCENVVASGYVAKLSSAIASHALWQRLATAHETVAGRGALALIDQAVYSGTSFVMALIISRMTSRETLGVFSLALLLVLLLRNLEEQLISTPYRVYCHRDAPSELASYTASVFTHQLTISAIGMLALPLCLAVMPRSASGGLTWPTMMGVVIAMPFILSREAIRSITFAKVKVVSALTFDLVVCGLQIPSMIVLGLTHNLTVGSAFLAMGMSCAVASCGWFLLQRNELNFRLSRLLPDWRRNWVIAKWALMATLATLITPLVAPWLLATWHSKAIVGIFAASVNLAGLPQMFIMGVNNWSVPQAARAYSNGGVKSMSNILAATFVVFLVLVGGFAIAAACAGNWLLVRAYGPDYAGSGNVLAIMALVSFANAMGCVSGCGLWAMELPQAHVKADVSILITTTLMALLLVGPLGPLGAATATFAGAAVGAVVRGCSLWLHMTRVKVALAGVQS